MSITQTILEVKNLVKIYDPPGIRANNNISFTVFRGEIYGVLGPNGAGKTTLLRQLTGQLKPTSGHIHVLGVDVVKYPHAVKSLISVCPQEIMVFGYLTVFEHLYYTARLKGLDKSDAVEQVEDVISIFDLKDYRNRLVGRLSSGLKRKVMVAQTFLGNSRLIFLDEPTRGLDPAARRSVWSLIQDYNKDGITFILTTHYMEEAEKLCSRIMFLNKGRIILEGEPDKIRAEIGSFVKIKFPEAAFSSKITFPNFCLVSRSNGWIEVVIPKREGDYIRELINRLVEVSAVFEVTMPSLEDVFLEVTYKNEVS
ncbi:MAG: ABC transporter ATP-binding protein [archaeon GB-1867-035]|nr:ABC transporter ATP-binding protein [Candidatus Culexmicrobium profundum]